MTITINVNEAAFKKIKDDPNAVVEMSSLATMIGFVDGLRNDAEKVFAVAVETTATVLVTMLQQDEMNPDELSGKNLSRLLYFLENNVPYDLENEIYNKIQEWRMYHRDEQPSWTNTEDVHLESAYEDRFEIGHLDFGD